MNKKIAKVLVGLPLEGPFDYSVDCTIVDSISIGKRVSILFNRKKRIGFVVGLSDKSDFDKLNPILEVLDKTPTLDEYALKLTRKVSEYYGCSWGEAIEAYLPSFLRKGKYVSEEVDVSESVCRSNKGEIVLVNDIDKETRWKYLSSEINKTINQNLGIIFLVPEAAQTKNILKKIKEIVDVPIAVISNKSTAKALKEQWESIRRGSVRIVVGTRSAIFAQVKDLGLIIVHNEENGSYKQEQSPFYRVQKVAALRSEIENVNIIFESATPSVEIWYEHNLNQTLKSSDESVGKDKIQIVDMTNYNPGKTSIVSFPVQNMINKCLESGETVLLLMNRRGFSTMTSCNQCGFSLKCPRCDVNLTYIFSKKSMVCSHCTFTMDLPKVCPECKGSYLRSVGKGVEKIVSDIARLYPQANLCSFDRDSKSVPKNANIIIATQAIFRVADDLKISLSAMLDFDAELNRFDFRSTQRAFSMLFHLKQLSKDKLVVQTRMPDHYCIQTAMKNDVKGFYDETLAERKDLEFPPFRHLVEIILRGVKEDTVMQYSKELFGVMKEHDSNLIEMLDPHPDIMPKLRDQYRYNIMLKGNSTEDILGVIKDAQKQIKKRRVIMTVNVDP